MNTVQTYTLADMRAIVGEYSNKQGRAPQVGVMGSAADLGYSEKVAGYAKEIGTILGKTGTTVIFGAEKDCDSLSTTVARAAKSAGGFTLGITYGNGKTIFDPTAASAIISMLGERGGPREAVVSRGSCDGIISIGGWSGTLNELVAAYQTGWLPIIPLVGMADTGWNTERFLGQKFDTRKERAILEPAYSPNEAVGLMLQRILEVQKTGKPNYPSPFKKYFETWISPVLSPKALEQIRRLASMGLSGDCSSVCTPNDRVRRNSFSELRDEIVKGYSD